MPVMATVRASAPFADAGMATWLAQIRRVRVTVLQSMSILPAACCEPLGIALLMVGGEMLMKPKTAAVSCLGRRYIASTSVLTGGLT
jgi:hypothetical protein